MAEITGLVKGLIEAPTADAQKAVLQKYYLPDASFDHPLCAALSTSNSRDAVVLPIYQWLKTMMTSHPHMFEVTSVAFDEVHSQLFFEGTQLLESRIPLIARFTAPWAP